MVLSGGITENNQSTRNFCVHIKMTLCFSSRHHTIILGHFVPTLLTGFSHPINGTPVDDCYHSLLINILQEKIQTKSFYVASAGALV